MRSLREKVRGSMGFAGTANFSPWLRTAATLLALQGLAARATPPADAGLGQRAAAARAALADAELRFVPPPRGAFEEAQAAVRAEATRVEREFALDPGSEAVRFWKAHLRWEMLERNLGPAETVRLAELEEVRRWMYSNRKGLESPFFAPLRTTVDAYLDAAYVASQPDLPARFQEQVALARQQCGELADAPTDARAAALARTLGWFQRTGQLAAEASAVRSLTSLPNAQLAISGELIGRIAALHASDIDERIALTESVRIPPGNRWQRSRTMRVRGTASTRGDVRIRLAPHAERAELVLVYEGSLDSTARGATGPVTLGLQAWGSARAEKPIYLDVDGLHAGTARVTPRLQSRLTDVDSESYLAERVARRRADQESSRKLMNDQARATAVKQLTSRFDAHVDAALAKIRGDVDRARAGLEEFSELTAPLVREGVALSFDGVRSSAERVELDFFCRGRDQPGAPNACASDALAGDVLLRVHASFFNNMFETILGGKTLSDEFLMKYAKVLHAELPPPLMVHTRAARWSLTMARHRPLELTIPSANRLALRMRATAVEIDGVPWSTPCTADLQYALRRDEYGDVSLCREGAMRLDADLPSAQRAFLDEKLGAFFGPVFNGGGVVAPEGGLLGALRSLQPLGVHADADWLTTGWNVPPAAVDAFLRAQETAQPPQAPPPAAPSAPRTALQPGRSR